MTLGQCDSNGKYRRENDKTGGNFFFFQAEDGIRDLVRSRGLGDVYKRQARSCSIVGQAAYCAECSRPGPGIAAEAALHLLTLSLIHI